MRLCFEWDKTAAIILDYHGQEALERRVDLLPAVAANPDGGGLGEGAEVVGLLHLVLGRPWDPPETGPASSGFRTWKHTQEREAMLNEHLLPVGDDPSRQRGPVVAAPPYEHHPAPPHNIRQKSASSVGQVVTNTL